MMQTNPFARAYYSLGQLITEAEHRGEPSDHLRFRIIDRFSLTADEEKQLKEVMI